MAQRALAPLVPLLRARVFENSFREINKSSVISLNIHQSKNVHILGKLIVDLEKMFMNSNNIPQIVKNIRELINCSSVLDQPIRRVTDPLHSAHLDLLVQPLAVDFLNKTQKKR